MMELDLNIIQQTGYIFSAILFIYGLKMLGKEATAVRGNMVSAFGMLIALLVTFVNVLNPILIFSAILIGAAIGTIFAVNVKMTSVPEMVALFNGFGGLSSFFLAWSEFNTYQSVSIILIITYLTVFIGGVTFSGSLIAYFKLSELFKGSYKTLNTIARWLLIVFVGYLFISLAQILLGSLGIIIFDYPLIQAIFLGLLVVALLSGLAFVIPIGGGDMPVVISLLNSLSGIAAALAGILLSNTALIVAGCLVGASGLILTLIMAKSMNRTLFNIFFVGFSDSGANNQEVEGEVKPISPEDTYLVLEAASTILVVPGYGMAVAQAQHVVKELGDLLENNGAEVSMVYILWPGECQVT